jgi:hypothetical protein
MICSQRMECMTVQPNANVRFVTNELRAFLLVLTIIQNR